MPVTTRNMAHQQQPNVAQPQEVVEPYKLNEIFSIIPEYDGNQIGLNTFLNSCKTAYDMAIGNQKVLLTIHIKNKLKGRASELVNSRNPNNWDEIKSLLENHFGDSRDLMSLIQDLQRMRQLPNESPLTFIARLQTHEAKMHASVHKQPLTGAQRQAQIQLTEGMVLNTLLTGLEPRIAHVVRAGNPGDMLTAIARVRRELQLNYFETQKLNRSSNTVAPIRKPNLPPPVKQCSYCKRPGHVFSECRQRQQSSQHVNPGNFQNFQNYPRPNFYNQNAGGSQPPQQQRPPVITPNPNFSSPRPPTIQPNPNYFRPNTSNNNNRKTLHLNQSNEPEIPNQLNRPNQNYQTDDSNCYPYTDADGYYTANNPSTNSDYCTANNYAEYDYNNYNYDYCTANGPSENVQYQTTFDSNPVNNQDFRSGPHTQSDPPNQQANDNMTVLQTQFRNMSLDNYNPNLNFPEQQFL